MLSLCLPTFVGSGSESELSTDLSVLIAGALAALTRPNSRRIRRGTLLRQALVLGGNAKVIGDLYQPSDIRVKEDFEDVRQLGHFFTFSRISQLHTIPPAPCDVLYCAHCC